MSVPSLYCLIATTVLTFSYDTRTVNFSFRHMDMGVRQTWLYCQLRRFKCPIHGVITQIGSICKVIGRFAFHQRLRAPGCLVQSRWIKPPLPSSPALRFRTVGMICERVVAEELDRRCLVNLFLIGVIEISCRKHNNYLTLVTNHETGKRSLWSKREKCK